MANAFDQFDNAFDQFDSAPPVVRPDGVLPDDLALDTPESQEKMLALPDIGSAQIEAPRIGVGRGLQDIGEGLKQIALEAGEFIGARERGSTKSFTKEAEQSREDYEESFGLFPNAKISRFIGANAPYAALPVKMPPGLFGKVMSMSTLGEVVGGTQFVPEGGSREANVLTGGLVGAGVPVVSKAVSSSLGGITKWADNALIQPFSKTGAYRDVAKFLKKEISENRVAIEKAVKDSIAKGENKTVAQIIAETTKGTGKNFGGMLVKLEKDLSKESDALKTIYDMQSKSQTGFLNKIAGTSDDLANAQNLRSANSGKLYTESFDIPIKADPKLAIISKNKYFRTAMRDANNLAEAEGVNAKENLTQYLHYVKEGLDKQLNVTDAVGKTALGRNETRIIGKVKSDLVDWLSKKNPKYNEARIQFQKDSIPVNRMEVGNELKNAFTTSLDQESAPSFASAIKNINKTVKKATGFGKGGLEGAGLTTDEIRGLAKIAKELKIEKRMEVMASKSKAVLPALTGETTISLPHILSRPIVITNHVLRALGKDRTPAYKKLLIDIVKDPKQFVKAYKLPSGDKRSDMASDIIQRLTVIGSASSINKEEK